MGWQVRVICCITFHLPIWYLRSTCCSYSFCALAPKTTGFGGPTLNSVVIKHVCYAASPVWATTCVHPLQTRATFSVSSRDVFTGVGEGRKGSLLISWPCLLLPQRNKSPFSRGKRTRGISVMCRTETVVIFRLNWRRLLKSRSNITRMQQKDVLVCPSYLSDTRNASSQQLPHRTCSDPDLQTHTYLVLCWSSGA